MLFAVSVGTFRGEQSLGWNAPCDHGRCQSVFGDCYTGLMCKSKGRKIPGKLRWQTYIY